MERYENFRLRKAEGIFNSECTFCKSTENLKELNFYGGYENKQSLMSFCICGSCRKKLANKLLED